MLKVLEVSLLDSADGVPVQIQELEVRKHAQSVARNRPARETAGVNMRENTEFRED